MKGQHSLSSALGQKMKRSDFVKIPKNPKSGAFFPQFFSKRFFSNIRLFYIRVFMVRHLCAKNQKNEWVNPEKSWQLSKNQTNYLIIEQPILVSIKRPLTDNSSPFTEGNRIEPDFKCSTQQTKLLSKRSKQKCSKCVNCLCLLFFDLE